MSQVCYYGSMFRVFRKWFIPSKINDYEPHLLRAWPVALILIISFGFFALAQFINYSLTDNNGFLAAVVSSVLVDLTNGDRAQEGLHGLAVSPTLTQAAQLKANHMAAHSYFAHNSPDGKSPWYFLNAAGYVFSYAGENLAVFFGDSEDVARAWMESPAHRANILSSNFTEIGIATAQGVYQGRQTVFVVQMFGTPRAAAPVATLQSQVISAEPNTGAAVSSEAIEVIDEEDVVPGTPRIIFEDESLIAVVQDQPTIPVTGSVQNQSTVFERFVSSPHTLLTYVYALLGTIVAFGLIFLVFFELRIQKPKNIAYGVLVLLVIGVLSYISFAEVVVASIGGV